MVGLLIGGSTLNMMSMIGFIMLMGLVVKNAILLVDNANQQVKDGWNLFDALVDRRRDTLPADHHDDARHDPSACCRWP
jgi:multidrug efflux pump subunit AcrB